MVKKSRNSGIVDPESGDSSAKENRNSSRATGSVTLDDVAKVAEVSPITVSRALNQPEKVAPKTLQRVLQAVGRTGYVPNMLAGGLASKRSRLVAAIVPTVANSVHAETISFFSDTIRQSGYQVILGESGYDLGQEEQLIGAVLSRRPDGILLTGIKHTAQCRRLLIAANIPVVETWDITPTPLDVVVGFSHIRVGEVVADYFLDKGYRRIGMVTADDQRARQREEAFVAVIKRKTGLDVAISRVSAPTSFRIGREGLSSLIDGGFQQGAVFCSSDTITQGALTEAQHRGFAIPEQLAFMGFGDQPYAAYTEPAMTTVRFDRAMIGQKAAEALLQRIEGEPVKQNVIDIGFSIIVRKTI